MLKRRNQSVENAEKSNTYKAHYPSKSQVGFKVPLKQMLRSTSVKNNFDVSIAYNETRRNHNPEKSLGKIRNVISLFEKILSEEKRYKSELHYILDEIKQAIFITKTSLSTEVLNQVLDEQLEILKDMTGEVPYFYIYDIVIKLNQEIAQSLQKSRQSEDKYKLKLDLITKEKDDQTNALKTELEEVKSKLERSENEVINCLNERITLENQLSKAALKINEMSAFIINQEDIISEISKLKYDLQISEKKLQGHVDIIEARNRVLDKQNKDVKKQYDIIENSYKLLLGRLKLAHKENENFELQVSSLEKSNSELYIRAAAGFEDLTPRPDLASAFEELDCEIPKCTSQEKAQLLCQNIKRFKDKSTLGSNQKKGRITPVLRAKQRPSIVSVAEDYRKSTLDSSRISNFTNVN